MSSPSKNKKRQLYQYYVYIPALNETLEDAEPFTSAFTNPSVVASEFAEYMYQERDGWDWMQPSQAYEIAIIYPDERVEFQEISYELEPFFYSAKVGATKSAY